MHVLLAQLLAWPPTYTGAHPTSSYQKTGGEFPKWFRLERFGQLDLAGSLWEWTLDAYAPYAAELCDDCASLGIANEPRVFRGGDYKFDDRLRCARRPATPSCRRLRIRRADSAVPARRSRKTPFNSTLWRLGSRAATPFRPRRRRCTFWTACPKPERCTRRLEATRRSAQPKWACPGRSHRQSW